MRTISFLPFIRPFALTILSSAVAYGATIFTGVLDIGNGTAKLSLTTDGTTGVLTSSDILAWDVAVAGPLNPDVFDEFSSQGCSICIFSLTGSDLTATSTSLFFNFSGSDKGGLLIDDPSFSPAYFSPFIELSATGFASESSGGLTIPSNENQVTESENDLIASVVTASNPSAPEPASWAVTLSGLLVLTIIRARSRKSARDSPGLSVGRQ